LLWWLSGWWCSTCWPAGAEIAVTAAAPPWVVARAGAGAAGGGAHRRSTKIAHAPLNQSREAHHSARSAFAEAHVTQHLATQHCPISATNHPSTRPRIPDGRHRAALRSTRNHPRTAVRRGAAWPTKRPRSRLALRVVMIWQVPHRRVATAAGAAGATVGPIRKERNGRLMGTQTSASGRIGPGSRACGLRFRIGVTIRTPSSKQQLSSPR
jgi:hypothetical protein